MKGEGGEQSVSVCDGGRKPYVKRVRSSAIERVNGTHAVHHALVAWSYTVPPVCMYAFALPTTAAKVTIASFIFEGRGSSSRKLCGEEGKCVKKKKERLDVEQ